MRKMIESKCKYCQRSFQTREAAIKYNAKRGQFCSYYCAHKKPILERFLSRVDQTANCWNWSGRLDIGGYGAFVVLRETNKSITIKAHRFSYTVFNQPIPSGLEIDHLCRNRKCVNPKHLEAVTAQVNALRGFGQGGINSRKTHCPKGHEYSEHNTRRLRKNGARMCRACEAIYRARKKALSK